MNKPDPDLVRDARQTFDLTGAAGNSLAPGSKPLRVKVFKSGNSLAVRMPKALGLEAGMELVLTLQPDGSFVLRRADAPRQKIDVSGFAGKAPWLKPLPRELREFEERPSTIAACKKAAGEGE
ncbi:MAG: AbrB/MazE/SpoVT family DNA-binding domain-containing protein [Novosphingobium sp.]